MELVPGTTLPARPSPDAWRGRRVLVTGHTGFKGAWLCARLLRYGAHVVGLALPPEGAHNLWTAAKLDRDVESHFADVRDLDATENVVAAANPEVVLHLAAQPIVRRGYREPVLTYATNVMGTVHVLDAVRRRTSAKAVVVVTSDKVYADAPLPHGYAEDARLGGADPYSGSKAAAELIVETYRTAYFSKGRGPALASARAGNVIGGGDFSEDRLLPDFFRALETRQPMVVRQPDAIRPWQHVLDPLAGYLMLAEALLRDPQRFAEPWNFAPDVAAPVREVLAYFADAWGIAGDAGYRFEPSPEYETHRLEIDAAKSHEHLGWQNHWTVATAVAQTATWYRDYLAGEPAADLVARDLLAHDTLKTALASS
jgi:CDP-glucose 4,6-dehydratase